MEISPVGIAFRVERGHVSDLLEVDIGENEFVIARVDDGWPVGTRKHIRRRHRAKHLKNRRLSAQYYLLLVTQRAYSVISLTVRKAHHVMRLRDMRAIGCYQSAKLQIFP